MRVVRRAAVATVLVLLAGACAERQETRRISPAQGLVSAPSPSEEAPPEKLQAKHPIDGFDLTPPRGFVQTGEPISGKIVGGDMAVRIYWNRAAGVKVSVVVQRDRPGETSAQGLRDFARYEGRVTEVEAVPGTAAMWELMPTKTKRHNRPAANPWTSLVARLPDGTYISINAVDATGFDIHYDFLFRMRDAPGSMPPG